jgi:hypothetical protein
LNTPINLFAGFMTKIKICVFAHAIRNFFEKYML